MEAVKPQPDWESDDGSVRLFCGDATELVPSLAPDIDVVIADPPYGISHGCNFRSRGRAKMAVCNEYPDVIGDDHPFDPSQILELGVPTVLWGGNHYASRLPDSGGWLVWDKRRPDELDQATCEMAWTNCVKGVRRFEHLWHGMMRASEHGENWHPMQKPVALGEWILRLRWIPDGTVFDPYMGACYMGVACVRLGRRFIGIEKDPRYFDIAKRRIQEAMGYEVPGKDGAVQKRMFVPE